MSKSTLQASWSQRQHLHIQQPERGRAGRVSGETAGGQKGGLPALERGVSSFHFALRPARQEPAWLSRPGGCGGLKLLASTLHPRAECRRCSTGCRLRLSEASTWLAGSCSWCPQQHVKMRTPSLRAQPLASGLFLSLGDRLRKSTEATNSGHYNDQTFPHASSFLNPSSCASSSSPNCQHSPVSPSLSGLRVCTAHPPPATPACLPVSSLRHSSPLS